MNSDQPSLDFNPRALVVENSSWAIESRDPPNVYLDGIFVPFRGRPEYVSQLFKELSYTETPIFLIPTSESDLPVLPKEPTQSIKYLQLGDPEFLTIWKSLSCLANGLCALNFSDWDLPIKRSYALWFARRHHFKKILLLDDDIRGLHSNLMVAGVTALVQCAMAGFFVDDFPDTSAIGHVEIALGETVWTFLSGSRLFVRSDIDLGFFPPIYNEDWLFMMHEIAGRQVAAIGSINQRPYDPFLEPSVAAFQEPGEIIADGLLALVASDRFNQRFDNAVWREILTMRREWLAELAARCTNSRHRAVVEAARGKCGVVSENDCVRFQSEWERDQADWKSRLKELD